MTQRQQLLAAHQQMLGYAGPAAQRPPASAQGQQLQPLPAAPSLAAHLLPPGHTQRQGSRQGSSATVSASVPAVSFLGGAVPGAASLVPSVQSVAARLGMRPAISASTGNLLAAQGAAPGTLAAGPLSPASETSMRFVTGPPRRDHWKRAVRLDQDANFHPAGLISRVCEPCFKEFQSHLHPLKPPLPIVNDTQDHAGEDETNAIPITLKENTKDVAQTPMMSVPTDWTWSSF
ncbi:Zn finger protein [Polyrhizophydium stewartii]|uniref:Zn finger protein n=1 Tax=Polyrhizophydium stewartii TaxID=2732419 RepID=A0ABR4N5L4_9FUNG